MHPSPGPHSTPAAVPVADNVSDAGQTEPMSNIASGGSSEYTLNQEPRPGDAVANDSARSPILGFSISDTDRDPFFEDDTVLQYKAQPAELVRKLYTAMIDISDARDLPDTRDFRLLTEKTHDGSGGADTYYETKMLVAFCWRVAMFMLDGAEKGFVRPDKQGLQLTERQLRWHRSFKLRLYTVTNALRREKSVLAALLHDGVGTILDFVYAPSKFELTKARGHSKRRETCERKDTTGEIAAARKNAVCVYPAWEELPADERGMSAKDADTWLNEKERFRGSGLRISEIPTLPKRPRKPKQQQPQKRQQEQTGERQQAEEQVQAEGQAQAQGQTQPEGHPATTPPSQHLQSPQQIPQPPPSPPPAEIAGPQPSMLTPIYPPAPHSAPPSTQLQPQAPASEPIHAYTGARQSGNQLRMTAPARQSRTPVSHQPSSSSQLRNSTTVENTTPLVRRSSYLQETIGARTPARVTETLGNSPQSASTASTSSTYSTAPRFGRAPPPRHGPQTPVPTPQHQQLSFGAAPSSAPVSAAGPQRATSSATAAPRPGAFTFRSPFPSAPAAAHPPNAVPTSQPAIVGTATATATPAAAPATTIAANQQQHPAAPPRPPPPSTISISISLDTSSFMNGGSLGVMPLAGYSVGHGRTWYDPTFHGMPFPAAQSAQSASVEGTHQGGGEQPDTEGGGVALMDVDQGTQGGGGGGGSADADAEGVPLGFMDVERVPNGGPIWPPVRYTY